MLDEAFWHSGWLDPEWNLSWLEKNKTNSFLFSSIFFWTLFPPLFSPPKKGLPGVWFWRRIRCSWRRTNRSWLTNLRTPGVAKEELLAEQVRDQKRIALDQELLLQSQKRLAEDMDNAVDGKLRWERLEDYRCLDWKMIGNDHILRVGQMSCGAHFPTFQDGQCVATIQLATHFHRAQGRSASSNFRIWWIRSWTGSTKKRLTLWNAIGRANSGAAWHAKRG